ncbi:MAG: hypothetical protein MI757_16250 [Pirellulales bacterium]|nr:hypothetical protein [Pirellulales bacterium]
MSESQLGVERLTRTVTTLDRLAFLASSEATFTARFQPNYSATRSSTDLNVLQKAYADLTVLCNEEAMLLRQAPPAFVDRELSHWQARRAALLHKSSLHFAALARNIAATRALKDYSTSGASLVESFVRGADGDPFGTTRDTLAVTRKLQEEYDTLLKQQQALANEEAELFADWDRVHRSVREEYHEAYTRAMQADVTRAIVDLTEAIRVHPLVPGLYNCRAGFYLRNRDYEKALADLHKVLRWQPKHVEAHSAVAWIYATSPSAEIRDSDKALRHAKTVCELTGWRQAVYFDTLAAAYAAGGNFTEAVKWQEKALPVIEQLPSLTDLDRRNCRERLALYRRGKPYRED